MSKTPTPAKAEECPPLPQSGGTFTYDAATNSLVRDVEAPPATELEGQGQ